jgi:hypothetical protein
LQNGGDHGMDATRAPLHFGIDRVMRRSVVALAP